MTYPRPCPPASGPLEPYAAQFDSQFHSLAQRHSFRNYLTGLLLPRDRPKTLTALAGAEPLVQAQAAEVQRLQYFLSESDWDAAALSLRTLELLAAEPETAPHAKGVLVIDDTGDRKDGSAIDHVARQYLGSVGKIDNGIVAVTTLWADEQRYYPLHVAPYTPQKRLAGGKQDPAFRTKPQMALALIEQARLAGIVFRAIVADCFYGDNGALEAALRQRHLPYVLARRGRVGLGWARVELAHSFEDAAGDLPARCWKKVVRRFRNGHEELWWAAGLTLFGYGPTQPVRAICATTDPCTLPELSTWYLTTNLSLREAPLADIVHLYGLRNWIEEGYKRMKDELGWADFMVRSDRAIRRHWALVCCAFAFCWWHEAYQKRVASQTAASASRKAQPSLPVRKKNPRAGAANVAVLATRPEGSARLAGPGTLAHTLLERLLRHAPAFRTRHAARRAHGRSRHQSLSPALTN